MGQTLEEEGRRAEDQIRWTRVLMGRAQRRLVSPGASRVIDFLALKMGLETFEADAVDAYYQAPEQEEVVVELRRRTLNVLLKLEGTRIAASAARTTRSGSELGGGILVSKLGF